MENDKLGLEKFLITLAPLLWIGFIIMGLVQLCAVYSFFHNHWHWNWFLSGLAGFILSYFPVVGSICGFIGALYAWGWEWWQASLLFFWWPALFIVISAFGAATAGGYQLFTRVKK